MKATILSLATEVPETSLPQATFSSASAQFLGLNPDKTRLLERITTRSLIEKRHTVIKDFANREFQGNFFEPNCENPLPRTGKRNDLYKEIAPKLAKSVCQSSINAWGQNPKDITHIIAVSCTGMIAPGLEFLLIKKLGLSPNIDRLGINFMGCFGAFKGLAVAKSLALENPKHRVLVVCTELCSLHFQGDDKTDTLVSNSIFGDGAAAAIVGVDPQTDETPLFEIHNQKSMALDETLELMTWEAGNHGYQMRLSPAVPHHLEQHVPTFSQELLNSRPFNECTWAIHPGGKAILESISKACNLRREQLTASWEVLRNYGNMSSPTFLFVLNEILKSSSKEWIIGLGFGPGLSFEGLLLKHVAK